MSEIPFLLIILDGLGDHSYTELKDRTPLEAANQKNISKIKSLGAQGLMDPIAPGVPPSSDTAHLQILGYDLTTEYFGRGPIEAIGEGIELEEGEIAFRADFGTAKVEDNKAIVVDRRAGRIPTEETRQLVELLNKEARFIDGYEFKVVGLTEHRAAVIVRGEDLSYEVTDNDPHNVNVPVLECQVREEAKEKEKAKRLAELMNKWTIKTMKILEEAKLNEIRKKEGKLPANVVLFRGAGIMKKLPTFYEKHGLKAAGIAGGALYKGVAKAVGMALIEVQGANGMPDTNIKGKFDAAKKALSSYDFVFLHLKATDYYSHKGDPIGKSEFISKFDSNLSILEELFKDIAIMVTGDHTTPCDRGLHSGEPVPVLVSAPSIRRDGTKIFSEREASVGSLGRIKGSDVMKIVLDMVERTVEFGTRPSPRLITYMPLELKPLRIS
ncbi:MAG: 2,3-bisphosphoglycerate-independent phosphoglycerate mutase [Thermoproteota archaeon]|nr:2,3-bisphosphoglycerate-independent phosphoglycerate mutase [Candidatus Brockarchaeota archaeon]